MTRRRMMVTLVAALVFGLPVASGQTPSPIDFTITAKLTKDAPRDPQMGMPSNVHAVRLEKEQVYSIEMLSDKNQPFLRIDDAAGNTMVHWQARGGNISRLRFTPAKSDVYLIRTAMPVQQDDASYKLSVKPYAVPQAKLHALAAPAKGQPAAVQAVLSNDDTPDQYRDFPGRVYEVELEANHAYTIDLISAQFDAYLLLQNNRGVTLAQDDDSGGNLNSRINFRPTQSGRYRLVASTFNGRMGAFTLRVTRQD